jgi:sRNA-binding carbon storage regulator CsrA
MIRFADGGVKLGIEAPKEIPILRAELLAANPALTSEESRAP